MNTNKCFFLDAFESINVSLCIFQIVEFYCPDWLINGLEEWLEIGMWEYKRKGYGVLSLSLEMELVIWGQIPDKTAYMSFCTDILEKDLNPSVSPLPNSGKIVGQKDFFRLE